MQSFSRHSFLSFFLALAILLPGVVTPLCAAGNENKEGESPELLDKTIDAVNPSSDTWLVAAWEFVRDHTLKAWNWLATHVHNVLTEDFKVLDTSIPVSIVLLVLLTLMMLSGAWGASIAQARRHPRVKFFAFGFFTFFAGPAWLLMNLDIKGEKEMLERLAKEAAAKKAEAEERERLQKEGQIEKGYEAPAVSNDGVVWNEEYFKSIQRKADGTPDGPWDVTYNNVHVQVLEILEVLPNLVSVRLVNQEGHEMRGRIPFARIEKWDRPTEQL